MKNHCLLTLLVVFLFLVSCTAPISTEPADSESTPESITDSGVTEKMIEISEGPPPSPFRGGWLSHISSYPSREFRVGANGEGYIVGAKRFGTDKQSYGIVTKLSKGGTPLWSKQWGPSPESTAAASDLAVLGQRGVAVVGTYLRHFEDNCPHPKPLDVKDPPYRVYLAFLEPKTGKKLWLQDSSECSNRHRAFRIAAAPEGNAIYISGTFKEKLSFGVHSILSKGRRSGFLAAFDATGKSLWLKKTENILFPHVFATQDGEVLILANYCRYNSSSCDGVSLSHWNAQGVEIKKTIYKDISLGMNQEVAFYQKKGFLFFQGRDKWKPKNLTRSLLKVNMNGKVLWRTSFQEHSSVSHAMGIDQEGSLYLTFYFRPKPGNERKINFLDKTFLSKNGYAIIKVSSDGEFKQSYRVSARNQEVLFDRIRFDASNAAYFYCATLQGSWLGPHLARENGNYIWKIPKMP